MKSLQKLKKKLCQILIKSIELDQEIIDSNKIKRKKIIDRFISKCRNSFIIFYLKIIQ